MSVGSEEYRVRRATVEDLEGLVRLRVAMFRETGRVSDADPMAEFAAATRDYFAACVASGELVAFVAEAGGGRLVASSGLSFIRRAPTRRNLTGRYGYLLNMYTEPAWRGRGIAAALVARVLEFARNEAGLQHIYLHAEPLARPIYGRAGFSADDEAMVIRL